jgi:hypothetical protein
MPCLAGLGLAFLINLCWQQLLELLQGDFANQLNYEEFMKRLGFMWFNSIDLQRYRE